MSARSLTGADAIASPRLLASPRSSSPSSFELGLLPLNVTGAQWQPQSRGSCAEGGSAGSGTLIQFRVFRWV